MQRRGWATPAGLAHLAREVAYGIDHGHALQLGLEPRRSREEQPAQDAAPATTTSTATAAGTESFPARPDTRI